MTAASNFLRDRTAASAAEFALLAPLTFLFIFGLIDAGRYMWSVNEAEKAAQMGVRYAVATDPVPTPLSSYSFAVTDSVVSGTAVPTANFDTATCTNTSCTCTSTTGGFCGQVQDAANYNGTAFNNIVTRMRAMYRPIAASNVQVEYRNVGLGFAGNPIGADVAALVTVKVSGVHFQPIVFFGGGTINLPTIRSSLTLEDAAGNVSN